MEIVGGFMMMMSIIGFFLAVVWLIMPFVVFAIKGKQDRALDVLESVESRLASIEGRLTLIEARHGLAVDAPVCETVAVDQSAGLPPEQNVSSQNASAEKGSGPETAPAV